MASVEARGVLLPAETEKNKFPLDGASPLCYSHQSPLGEPPPFENPHVPVATVLTGTHHYEKRLNTPS